MEVASSSESQYLPINTASYSRIFVSSSTPMLETQISNEYLLCKVLENKNSRCVSNASTLIDIVIKIFWNTGICFKYPFLRNKAKLAAKLHTHIHLEQANVRRITSNCAGGNYSGVETGHTCPR